VLHELLVFLPPDIPIWRAETSNPILNDRHELRFRLPSNLGESQCLNKNPSGGLIGRLL
jgi:hypothetical protein